MVQNPPTDCHSTSHGAINPPQEPSYETSCDPSTQSYAHATSKEAIITPQEPPGETPPEAPHNPSAIFLETAYESPKDDENISCDHPITIPVAINIIHEFSRELYQTPEHIYAEIVRSVQEDSQIQWSDNKLWSDIIERSFFKDHRHTVFNLLEYIGASEWFDQQVLIARQSFLTKRNQPIQPSTAAGKVLDIILKMSDAHSDNISSKIQKARRQRIWVQLYRGKELRNKLVKALGLGILFSPKIWPLLYLSSDKLDKTISFILADPEQMTLLQLLSKQLEYLVNSGSTDLQAFCNGLKEHGLISEQELENSLVALLLDKENDVHTQIENRESLHNSGQAGPASSDHAAAPQSQFPQVVEPNFNVYKDDDTSSIIGFGFENVNIISEEISDVKENLMTMKENITAAVLSLSGH
ncbi:hypothetical protein BJX63DRAFT_133845 [Aspergillus granulosus]|uniref:Uncharacterized protein n=1 Tax=Aspergillus granulosus TaxID=176169 RepID=A0ABR4GTB3_9EURO